ncbi:GatB/YqeY domain-containing protein [Periweissella fabalis]|uniref:GatB/YqeY domain-containing protein n=1 Tax=Periweissella fabalis TaxID=1070421 RepID=A0A7X6N4U3_9LACO|nr:GatB/YqeY domain-containing protein [Periweissella fabalis]MCM0598729.1 GatB/YqeY domain-containing protein [Periweissella fabalis]NKZ24672.1 GatB/YqeY domain-containing protein [Periweissella fabalis]
MSVLAQLTEDMKTAMKAKDKETLSTVRMLKSAIQNEQINAGHDLNDEEELTIIAREMKQRRDSMAEFKAAGREDLVAQLEAEIAVVTKYMPAQMSEAEIKQIVADTIAEVGATSKADFGKVMGALMPKVKGKADGKIVNETVKALLG